METVYLAGLINPNSPRSIEWRNEADARLKEHFRVLNPLRGKDLVGDTVFSDTDGMFATHLCSRPIVARDYHDVQRSDYLLVNLDPYDSRRPTVGTLFELAWAWQLGKPAIVFWERMGSVPPLIEHPFVVEATTEKHYSLDSALDSLVGYYACR
jgi:nucleoside 2-deoxyribosyltransferase